MGSRMVVMGAKGGRNGRNSSKNDREVTNARRTNSLPLKRWMSLEVEKDIKNLPIDRPEVKAFRHQITPDGRGIIQCHLLESKAKHKAHCSHQILPGRQEVQGQQSESWAAIKNRR